MIQAPSRAPRQPKPVSIRDFKGVDVTGTRDIRRAAEMVNMVLDDEGTPEMRTGYEPLWETSLGEGPILGIHRWLDIDGSAKRLIHHGTKLYVCTPDVPPVEVYDGMEGTKPSTSFELATRLCILDGHAFVVYDGALALDGEAVAYIPTRYINRTPLGGGTLVEDFNLLQPAWRDFFTTVSGTTTYQVSEANLTSIEEVQLNGVVQTGWTVNLATGVVTLAANPGAPPGNGTNNLRITPKKVVAGYPDRIKKCTVSYVYGGPSDSKVFLSGNPDYPHIDWWTGFPYETGAYDPTYWPDTYFDRVGGDNDPIVGYSVQYDYMIVHKRRSNFKRTYEVTEDAFGRTVTRFPTMPLNKAVGCVDSHSIALVNNNPWYLSDDGVYEMVGTSVRDQTNVRKVSTLIGLRSQVGDAIVHDGRYYLSVADNVVWVADFNRMLQDEATGEFQPVWYKWENIPAEHWCAEDGVLFFGSNVEGMVYRFKDKTEPLPYNDNGVAISPCYWTMVMSTMDRDDMTKLIMSLIITEKPSSQADMRIEYETEEGWFSVPLDEDFTLAFLDYGNIDYGSWSYLSTQNPQAFKVRIDNARGVQRFRVRIRSSGVVDVFTGFASIDVNFQYLAGVR